MQERKTDIGRTLISIRDLRRARRYRLKEVVAFSWELEDGTVVRMTGITQDISIVGVSIVAASGIEVGTRIKLDLFLLSSSRTAQAIRLHAEGFVRRVESSGTGKVVHRIAADIVFQKDPDEIFVAIA